MRRFFKIIYNFIYFLSILFFCFVTMVVCYNFYLENVLNSFFAGIFIILFVIFCAGWKIYFNFKKTTPAAFNKITGLLSDLFSFIGMVSIFYLYFIGTNKSVGYIMAEFSGNKISVFFNVLNVILVFAFIFAMWEKTLFKKIYKILALSILFPILYLILFILTTLSAASAMESYFFL